MAAPLCIGCHGRTVRRRVGGYVSKVRGPRIIDGIHWRWFCSKPCASAAMGRANMNNDNFKIASQAHRDKARLKALARLVVLCKASMDPDERIPVKRVVKAFMVERALAYSRGYSAGLLSRSGSVRASR